MTKEEAKALILKYNSGLCSDGERELVEDWYSQFAIDEASGLSESDFDQIGVEMWAGLPDEVKGNAGRGRSVKLWPRIAAAAAVLLVVGLGVFFYTSRHLEGSAATRDLVNDLNPGSNKAYLILSNGKRVSLTDAANGAIAKEAGVEITKTADGQVIYTTRHPEGGTTEGPVSGNRDISSLGFPRHDGGRVEMTAMNTIETPKGGQYQVRLPDGSKVWLNAASKLIYPVSFTGRGQREVTLSGEAYFEIAKDKSHPFHVKTLKQDVEVLGTHFNINSYADEPNIKTTLLEGSVKVNDAILKPGQQSILAGGKIKVVPADLEEAVAWKNGLFRFENADLPTVMRQIARWYDVDIVYPAQIPEGTFTGEVYRNMTASKVLDGLGFTGVKFKIEGKKIIITH
jgi:ferric-dicitrate binding protein FerR (iron transport regulator)